VQLAKPHESLFNVGSYLLDRVIAIDFLEPPLTAIMFDDRSSLRREGLHPFSENRFGVIGPLYEGRAIHIANARDCWRIRIDIVDATSRGDTSTSNAMQKLIVTYDDADRDNWKSAGILCQLPIQPLSLIDGSRKAVENITAACIRAGKAVRNHLIHEIVRDELPLIHEGFSGFAQLRSVSNVGAEQVTGGDLRNTVGGHESLGLSAFADARSA
jgi:hypothetical protein